MTPHPRSLLVVASVLALAASVGCSQAPNVADADITEHVKTALQSATSLQGTDIAVVTSKGDVRLTGAVDTQAQVDDALRIARAADGAHTVHDELTLKPRVN